MIRKSFGLISTKCFLKDDLWNSFITESVAMTKPEIASLFIFSNTRMLDTGDQRRQSEKRIGTNQSSWSGFNKRGRVAYFVAGYEVFSLRNNYKMLKSSKHQAVAVAALQFLDLVKIDGDSSFKSRNINMYIQDWLDRVDRGALRKVNGDIFNFIFKLEAVLRISTWHWLGNIMVRIWKKNYFRQRLIMRMSILHANLCPKVLLLRH